MATQKAIVYLNNGQSFQCPVENLPTVKRIYAGQYEKIKYPGEDVGTPVQQTAPIEVKKPNADVVVEAKAPIKTEPADYTESNKRLTRANIEGKSMAELREMIKKIDGTFKSTSRNVLVDFIVTNYSIIN